MESRAVEPTIRTLMKVVVVEVVGDAGCGMREKVGAIG
jgi:hypothetical protein